MNESKKEEFIKKPASHLREAYEELAKQKLEFFKHMKKTLSGYNLRIKLLDGGGKVKVRFSESKNMEEELLSVLMLAGNSHGASVLLLNKRNTKDFNDPLGSSRKLLIHIDLQYEEYWLGSSNGDRVSEICSFDGFSQLVVMLKALGVWSEG